MKVWIAVISISLIIFLAGCVKEKSTEIQFKNDIVTVENLVITNLAPYERDKTNIEFDVQSNGDRPVSKITVNLFDIPGFDSAANKLNCQLVNNDDKNLFTKKQIENGIEKGFSSETTPLICEFNNLEPLDSRHITLGLTAKEIASPTPYTISFSIKYDCNFGAITESCVGTRAVTIPIIDGVIKKEPSFKFFQSEPNFGPVVIDIQPLLEHQKSFDGKTIKEYWGTLGQAFTTKFVLKHVGTLEGKIKTINVDTTNLHIKEHNRLTPIDKNSGELVGVCDFNVIVEQRLKGEDYYIENFPHKSKKPINETFNTLICSFQPESITGFESEFTSTIKIEYAYSYEFIRSVNFVVYPRD